MSEEPPPFTLTMHDDVSANASNYIQYADINYQSVNVMVTFQYFNYEYYDHKTFV